MRVTRSGRVERSVGIFKVDQNVVVDRPVEAVFAFLSNIENWAQVQPALRESEGGSPRAPMEVGGDCSVSNSSSASSEARVATSSSPPKRNG